MLVDIVSDVTGQGGLGLATVRHLQLGQLVLDLLLPFADYWKSTSTNNQ